MKNKDNISVTAKLLLQKHNRSEARRKEMKWAISDKQKRKELATIKQ